jgi:hypothetical protein
MVASLRIVMRMATVQLHPPVLSLRLTRGEKIAGLLRDVDVPLAAVRGVEVVPDGVAATRGLRAPGLGLPRLRKIGTWRSRDGRALVSVRRGQPAVRIRLEGQRWDELLVGTDDASGLATALAAVR